MTRRIPILIVSTSPTLRDVLTLALNQEGYRVRMSNDDRLDPGRVASVDPSMVIFAHGSALKNPYPLVEPLRLDQRTSSIPVLVCGPRVADQRDAPIQQVGYESLGLPFDLDGLYEAINRLLARQSDADSSAASQLVTSHRTR